MSEMAGAALAPASIRAALRRYSGQPVTVRCADTRGERT
jgi:hypothetical protein